MADLAAMTQPFADEELHTFQGAGGKTLTYIEDETVMDRLDLGFGPGNWQVAVEAIPYVEGVVKVTLSVRIEAPSGSEFDSWVQYQDFGYPNNTGAAHQLLKEAVSDGIRRCGRYLGIARDLYRKDSGPLRGQRGPAGADAGGSLRGVPASVIMTPEDHRAIATARSSTAVPEPPLDWDMLDKSKPEPFGTQAVVAREVDGTMTTKELLDRADSGQVPVDALAQASKKLYGPKAWQIKALTDVQRYTVAVEVGLA